MRLIIAAGKYIAVGGDYYPAPHPQTAAVQALAVIETVDTFGVTTIPLVGRHERMSLLVVVELGGLEDQAVGAEGFIDALELAPFVLVRL